MEPGRVSDLGHRHVRLSQQPAGHIDTILSDMGHRRRPHHLAKQPAEVAALQPGLRRQSRQINLVRTYYAAGGLQIQISVLDREAMLAAQREPEKHADLIVRVGGYSEYFAVLSKELQDSVIARTEHSLR